MHQNPVLAHRLFLFPVTFAQSHSSASSLPRPFPLAPLSSVPPSTPSTKVHQNSAKSVHFFLPFYTTFPSTPSRSTSRPDSSSHPLSAPYQSAPESSLFPALLPTRLRSVCSLGYSQALPSLRDGPLPLEPRAASRLRGTHRTFASSAPRTVLVTRSVPPYVASPSRFTRSGSTRVRYLVTRVSVPCHRPITRSPPRIVRNLVTCVSQQSPFPATHHIVDNSSAMFHACLNFPECVARLCLDNALIVNYLLKSNRAATPIKTPFAVRCELVKN